MTMTFRRVRICLFLMLLGGAFINNALSQSYAPLNWSDRYVTLSSYDQVNKTIARPAREAYSIVAWERHIGSTSKIFVQKIDGVTGLALWSPLDGIEVASGTQQYNPKVTYDTLGGVYIAWENRELSSYTQVYLQKLLLSTGAIDMGNGWPVTGINVSQILDSFDQNIIGDPLGCYIVWTAYGKNGDTDVWCNYITYQAGMPWTAPRIVANSDRNEYDPVITTNGDYAESFDPRKMSAYIAFVDENNGSPSIFGTMYHPDGIRLPLYQLNTAPYMPCANPSITETGTIPGFQQPFNPMGAIIAWEEDGPNGLDIRVQNLELAINSMRPTGVQYNPSVALCTQPENQTNVAMDCSPVPSFDGGMATWYCYFAWQDGRNLGTTGIDIYSSYINVYNGAILATPQSGVATCTEIEDQTQPDLEVFESPASGSDVVNICWADRRTGAYDIYYQDYRIPLYLPDQPVNGWAVTTNPSEQTNPEIGKNIVMFADDRSGYQSIYYQKIDIPYSAYGPSKMLWRGEYPSEASDYSAVTYKTVMDANGNSYITWETKYNATYSQVYVQKMSSAGVPLWTNGGVAVGASTVDNTTPDVCIASNGGCIVTWLEVNYVLGTQTIKYRYFDQYGSPATIYSVSANGQYPAIADDGNNRAHIAFTGPGNYVNVYRVESNGTITGVNVYGLRDYKYGAKIIKTSNGGFAVAAAHDQSDYQIYSFMSLEGGVIPCIGLYNRTGFDIVWDDYGSKLLLAGNFGQTDNELGVIRRQFNTPSFAVQVFDGQNQYTAGGVSIAAGNVGSLGFRDALVAFNTFDNTTNQYQVRFNAVQDWTLYRPATAAPEIETNISATSTDIIWEPGMMNSKALMVWSGNGYLTGQSAVKAQLVDLSITSGYPGVWANGGEFVSAPPFGVTTVQKKPLISWNTSANYPVVYMLSTVQSRDMILGASIFNYQNTMYWYKQQEAMTDETVHSFDIVTPYPSPYSISNSGAFSIPLSKAQCDDAVTVNVYDVLGKMRISVSSENLVNNIITIDAGTMRKSLSPGMYMMKIVSTNGVNAKPFVVTK